MREASIFSGVFHLGLLLLVAVGLPVFRAPPPDPEPVSTVEVVTMAPKATAPDLPKQQAPKQPEVKPTPPPPAPPTPPVAKDPTPPPPTPPVAKLDPVPTPPEVIPTRPADAPKPPPPPPPPKKVEEPKKDPPKKPDPFDSILKNLTKTQPAPTKDAPKPLPQQAYVPPPPVQGAHTLAPQLARSEMDAIRDHIRPCWNFPAGAKDAQELFVLIDVWMNPDATVREARIADGGRRSDPYYQAAAESALRAVLNCGRRPLPLTPEKYNTWKKMTLRFDPRDL